MKEEKDSLQKLFNSFLSIKKLVVLLIVLGGFTIGYGQVKPDKTEAEIKKQETQLKIAKTNLAKIEKQVTIADSLADTGTKMLDEADTEFEDIQVEQKKLDKEYATQSKLLTKKMNGKDKDAALEAKNEFKAVDLKYKADVKDLATRKKAVEKKSLTGKTNLDKGKSSKKTSAGPYQLAQDKVAAIEAKIEALKSGDEDTGEKGKKGKKK